MNDPEFTGVSRFGDDGNGRGLERAEAGEKLSLGKGSYVPPFGELVVYHFLKFNFVRRRRFFVGGRLNVRKGREIYKKTIAHSGGNLHEAQEKTRFAQGMLPHVSFVQCWC